MKRERESREMAAAVGRFARAMVRRANDGDLEALEALEMMRRAVDEATVDAARALNEGPQGYSWSVIGQHLGCSRQNARQRFSRQP